MASACMRIWAAFRECVPSVWVDSIRFDSIGFCPLIYGLLRLLKLLQPTARGRDLSRPWAARPAAGAPLPASRSATTSSQLLASASAPRYASSSSTSPLRAPQCLLLLPPPPVLPSPPSPAPCPPTPSFSPRAQTPPTSCSHHVLHARHLSLAPLRRCHRLDHLWRGCALAPALAPSSLAPLACRAASSTSSHPCRGSLPVPPLHAPVPPHSSALPPPRLRHAPRSCSALSSGPPSESPASSAPSPAPVAAPTFAFNSSVGSDGTRVGQNRGCDRMLRSLSPAVSECRSVEQCWGSVGAVSGQCRGSVGAVSEQCRSSVG